MGAGPSRRLSFLREGDGIVITEDAIRRIAREGDSEERSEIIADQGTHAHHPQQYGGSGHMPAEELGRAMGDLHRRIASMDEALKEAYDQGMREGITQMSREKDHEIRMHDIAWHSRLEATLTQREDENTEEFNKTVAALSSKFNLKRPQAQCQAQKAALMRCYRENPGRSLNCADVLETFSNCAASARQDYLARQR